MLKQRQPRLLPETMAEKKRRVYSSRQYGSCDSLRDVIELCEFSRIGLEMNLETCITGFHHYVVVSQMYLVETFDVNREFTAPHLVNDPIQLIIARVRRHVFQR